MLWSAGGLLAILQKSDRQPRALLLRLGMRHWGKLGDICMPVGFPTKGA